MDWHIKEREYSRTFRDASGNDWGYITARKLSARYPNGGYRIVADLKKKENSSGENFLTGGTQRACLYPYKRKHTRAEKTVGYIDVSDPDHPDSFVRIRTGNLFKGVILPAAILLLLCGLFLLGWYLSRKEEVPGLDEAAVSYKVEGMVNTDPESIALPGVSVIEMEAGTSRVEFPLVNPEGNTCYMKYTICDAQTDEKLYTSGLIAPGQAVLSFDLDRTMEAGTYDILLQVETSDVEDYTVQLNGAEIPAKLEVK